MEHSDIEKSVILVVDEHDSSRDLLVQRFEGQKITVFSASTNEEAIAIIQKEHIDLVFLDPVMSNVCGFEVLKFIRSSHRLWELPVVIMNSQNDTDSILEAYSLGANDFISKPVNFSIAMVRAENHYVHKELYRTLNDKNISLERLITEKTDKLNQLVNSLEDEVERGKKVEQELLVEKRKVEESNTNKSTFLANIGNELRSPLSAILGFVEILKTGESGKKSIQDYKDYIDFMYESTSNLIGITNDILLLSKIEAQKLELSEVKISVKKLINPAVSVVQKIIEHEQKDVIIDVVMDKPDTVVYVDGKHIKQIITYLLASAVKFIDSSGRLSLELVLSDVHGIFIVIKDQDTVIDEEYIVKAMTPFSQLDLSMDSQYSGIGLGLSLVKPVSEIHGGTFNITSVTGEGTKYQIHLPASRIENIS